jgi:hypothetical protein
MSYDTNNNNRSRRMPDGHYISYYSTATPVEERGQVIDLDERLKERERAQQGFDDTNMSDADFVEAISTRLNKQRRSQADEPVEEQQEADEKPAKTKPANNKGATARQVEKIVLDDDGQPSASSQPAKRQNPPRNYEDEKAASEADNLAKAAKRKMGVGAPRTALRGKTWANVRLLIAAMFGEALVATGWYVGAYTSVAFLVAMGFSLPVEIQEFPGTGWKLGWKLNLIWLAPIGLTAFQIAYKPPLSFKGFKEAFKNDPAVSTIWLALTSIGITTTFFGLVNFFIQRGLAWSLAWLPVLILIFLVALAIEYLCEPLAIRFAIEFWWACKNLLGLKA